MRVVPRRYDYCIECDTQTVQWLIEAPMPRRNAWGARKPAVYVCRECGEENF